MHPLLAACAFAMALATSAHAADKCLAAGAELGDERDLTAFRAQLDAGCPCAAYDGSSGHGRTDFRRCGKSALDAAIDATRLRAACRANGKTIVTTATCGTHAVACGRFRPKKKSQPVGCKVVPAKSCVDTPSIDTTVCAQDYCSDVTRWTAGTCVDPRDDGSQPVGVRVLTITKPSVAHPDQTRELDTPVWYPTDVTGADDPTYHGTRNAPLAGGPYPLLVFSHGACGNPMGESFLLPWLASYGFVVAAPPHPGNTSADFPACLGQASLTASAIERPADATAVIDTLLADTADTGSPLHGAVDGTRIAMSGHSFGGYTTFVLAQSDPRVKVALLMAPAVPSILGTPAIAQPMMMMLGAIDSVSIGGTTNDIRRTTWNAATGPKLLVEVQHAGHFAFSDNCLPGYPDCNPPVTLTQDEAHDVVRRWVLPFLEVYLAGDHRYEPFLAPPPPPDVALTANR